MGTVEFSLPAGDDQPARTVSGVVEDTPEVREWLEGLAIPKCKQWREANPELIGPAHAHNDGTCTKSCWMSAPYCPSAYCLRCAGLRALDGEAALLPNEWMTK
jgi:hypothetical protein